MGLDMPLKLSFIRTSAHGVGTSSLVRWINGIAPITVGSTHGGRAKGYLRCVPDQWAGSRGGL